MVNIIARVTPVTILAVTGILVMTSMNVRDRPMNMRFTLTNVTKSVSILMAATTVIAVMVLNSVPTAEFVKILMNVRLDYVKNVSRNVITLPVDMNVCVVRDLSLTQTMPIIV